MPITPLAEFPEVRLGHVDSVLVSVWYSRLTIPSLDLLEQHHRSLAAKYGKVTFLSVVAGAAENPPPDVRERMNRTSEEMAKFRRANIIVVKARGLGAIIARSFLAAIAMFGKENIKVFKTTDEAVTYLKALPDQDEAVRGNGSLAADVQAFVDQPAP